MKKAFTILRRLLGGAWLIAGAGAIIPYSCVRVGNHHDGFGLPVYHIPLWVQFIFGADADWHGWLTIPIFIGWLVWMAIGLGIYGSTTASPHATIITRQRAQPDSLTHLP